MSKLKYGNINMVVLKLPLALFCLTLASCVGQGGSQVPQPLPTSKRIESDQRRSTEAETKGGAEPFKGITTNGTVMLNLFPVRSIGVSTLPVRRAAETFLSSLSKTQRAKTLFAVDDPEWRNWMNQHFYVRKGVGFLEMSEMQREAAFGLLRASLSAKGLKQTSNIMRLNHTLGELNNNFDEYGEGRYWITFMGTPSDKEPWGWQLDGHHLIVNYFVMGGQVVMTPTFMGSEPVTAYAGKYKGTTVMQDEQNRGLEMINALDEAQRLKAIIEVSKTGNNNVSEAYKDNVILDYAGIRASELTAKQKSQLLDLIGEHVGNMRDGHAQIKMVEVQQHLDRTWFAWIGETEQNSVFYYRIHSPVLLIEFDHQTPIALRNLERSKPTREHIHSIVRTPNGNDYGKDLLRQHYQQHPHPHKH